MSRLLPKLIVILGPTASGKTDLAVMLAKKFKGEIINADSRQIYKEMDIGTAKPKLIQKNNSPRKRTKNIFIYKNILHHLINIVKPDQSFTLSQYQKLAIETIKDVQSRGKIPFLVGGTGLYIQSIVDNLKIPEVPPNKKVRKQLEKLGGNQLLDKLKELDPITLKTIDKNNRRRVVRALEVCIITGKPFSQLRRKGQPILNTLQIGISVPWKELCERIEKRVHKMTQQGLEKEVKKISKKYSFNLSAMSGIGYKEFEAYFKKQISLDETIEFIKKNTRNYAKKQLTWFKKDKRINWIKNRDESERLVRKFLKQSYA